ncbi:MAG: nitrilase-related carbon-nitrogen hydrolase, partial [Maioricimonas sp. JB049]
MSNRTDKAVVALIQSCATDDLQQNLDATVEKIREAAKQGAQIVCTQELFRSPYFCQSEDHDKFQLAESIPGPSTEALAAVAREHEIVIVGSLFERRAPGLY